MFFLYCYVVKPLEAEVAMETMQQCSKYDKKSTQIRTAENPFKSVPPYVVIVLYTVANRACQAPRVAGAAACDISQHIYTGRLQSLCIMSTMAPAVFPMPCVCLGLSAPKPSAVGSPLALLQLVWLEQLQHPNMAPKKRCRAAAAAAEPQAMVDELREGLRAAHDAQPRIILAQLATLLEPQPALAQHVLWLLQTGAVTLETRAALEEEDAEDYVRKSCNALWH